MNMIFERSATETTPEIKFDKEANSFIIEGRSLAEDAATFYGEAVQWLSDNLTDSSTKAEFVIKLDYCNTSSFLGISHILKKLEQLNKLDSDFSVKWRYEKEDEDWLEDGQNFKEIVDLPFVFESFVAPPLSEQQFHGL